MAETTTIEVTKAQKAELEERKEHPKEPHKSVIGRLLDDEPERETSDVEQVLAEFNGNLTYDDVKQACQAAIRDELPEVVR